MYGFIVIYRLYRPERGCVKSCWNIFALCRACPVFFNVRYGGRLALHLTSQDVSVRAFRSLRSIQACGLPSFS